MNDEPDLVESVEQCRVDAETRAADLSTVADSIDQTEVTSHTDVFGALSSETRYRIIRYLAANDDECCVCELAPLLDVSESAVSHALSVLVSAGLVTRRKDGRWRYYDVSERASELLDVIVDESPVEAAV
ncbi:MAG: ArsR/SmtB family transcription factor [archaeon]